ncbi:hypothetical protein WA158_000546 [Blastocystis sp. Blastoise]
MSSNIIPNLYETANRTYKDTGFQRKKKRKNSNNDQNSSLNEHNNSQISQVNVNEIINNTSNDDSNVLPTNQLLSNLINLIADEKLAMDNLSNNDIYDKIEKIIFNFWISLKTSMESIILIYKFVNNLIELIMPTMNKINVPLHGQQAVQRLVRLEPNRPQTINIYLSNCCNSLLGFNIGKESIDSSKRTCTNIECQEKSCRKISIIPIIPRIRKLLRSSTMIQDISFYKKEDILSIIDSSNNNTPSNVPLYLTSSIYRRYIEKVLNNGDIFLTFSLTCDGISAFSHSIIDYNKSSCPVLLKLLNYNNKRYYDRRTFWPYTVTSDYHSWKVLSIIVEEFKELEKGIEMDIMINDTIQRRRVVGLLFNVYGDYAEMTSIGSFTGSSSSYPCRCCNLKWERDDEHFHDGIKCSFSKVSDLIDKDEMTNHIERIHYPIILNNNGIYI